MPQHSLASRRPIHLRHDSYSSSSGFHASHDPRYTHHRGIHDYPVRNQRHGDWENGYNQVSSHSGRANSRENATWFSGASQGGSIYEPPRTFEPPPYHQRIQVPSLGEARYDFVDHSPGPRICQPVPIRLQGAAIERLNNYEEFEGSVEPRELEDPDVVALNEEYDQWLDEENEISPRYRGLSTSFAGLDPYTGMDPVLAEALRRIEDVDTQHKFQGLLRRRAAVNHQIATPQPFFPRGYDTRGSRPPISTFQPPPPEAMRARADALQTASRQTVVSHGDALPAAEFRESDPRPRAPLSATQRLAADYTGALQPAGNEAPTSQAPIALYPVTGALILQPDHGQTSTRRPAFHRTSFQPAGRVSSLQSGPRNLHLQPTEHPSQHALTQYMGYTIFGQRPGQVSREPSPIPQRRPSGRRWFESGRSTPGLLRSNTFGSRRSSPGPRNSIRRNQ